MRSGLLRATGAEDPAREAQSRGRQAALARDVGPGTDPRGWGSRLPVAEARGGGGGRQDRGNSSRRAASDAPPPDVRPAVIAERHQTQGFNGLGLCVDWWNFGAGVCETQWEAERGGAGEPEGLQVPACTSRGFWAHSPRTLGEARAMKWGVRAPAVRGVSLETQ